MDASEKRLSISATLEIQNKLNNVLSLLESDAQTISNQTELIDFQDYLVRNTLKIDIIILLWGRGRYLVKKIPGDQITRIRIPLISKSSYGIIVYFLGFYFYFSRIFNPDTDSPAILFPRSTHLPDAMPQIVTCI